MYGAIIGDIVGSKYEFHNIKTKEFPLFSQGCDFTDDTIMTVAVAEALMKSREERFCNPDNGKYLFNILIDTMRKYGKQYPDPAGAYGGNFSEWLTTEHPRPYGSYGNGSAMRVSPCAMIATTLEEAITLAKASALVTHNHREGVKGAEATAVAIFLAKDGKSKQEIREWIQKNYYDISFTLDEIRDSYTFESSCQKTVPHAIVAFLESNSFEDAIRNAISIGGDSDTIGAISGSIAWMYYAQQSSNGHIWNDNKIATSMIQIRDEALSYLPVEMQETIHNFYEICWQRDTLYQKTGTCKSIFGLDEFTRYQALE